MTINGVQGDRVYNDTCLSLDRNINTRERNEECINSLFFTWHVRVKYNICNKLKISTTRTQCIGKIRFCLTEKSQIMRDLSTWYSNAFLLKKTPSDPINASKTKTMWNPTILYVAYHNVFISSCLRNKNQWVFVRGFFINCYGILMFIVTFFKLCNKLYKLFRYVYHFLYKYFKLWKQVQKA